MNVYNYNLPYQLKILLINNVGIQMNTLKMQK